MLNKNFLNVRTPLGSHSKLVYEVNLMKLLYDCLDMMRVSRDDAEDLLQELTTELPKVVCGSKTRFEVVDTLVRKWLLKYGGDPSLYKKQTRAFDALATLADRLLKQHIEAMEGMQPKSHEVMKSLEVALRDVAGEKQPLRERVGPALATLLHTTQGGYLDSEETMTMTMTSLVKALTDDDHPLNTESIDAIEVTDVVEDIKDCGIVMPIKELENLVKVAINSLRAQIIGPEERHQIDKDVEEAIRDSRSSVKDSSGSSGSKKSEHGK